MKKIAQGRARRRDRQLEAAERQALFTERNLAQAQKQLAAYQQDLKRTKGEVMAAIQLCPVATQRLVERQADRAQKLAARLLEDQHRLQQLRAGNYPL